MREKGYKTTQMDVSLPVDSAQVLKDDLKADIETLKVQKLRA
jgi:hypothetical protein